MHPDARQLRGALAEASGAVAGRGFESFRSGVFGRTVDLALQHFSQKCICVPPDRLPEETAARGSKVDAETELVLELDQPPELAELLRVLVAA